jgi:hypothetical protein
MRRIWRNNGLSIVLVAMFALSMVGQTVAGHREHNDHQRDHAQPELSYGAYLRSPAFLEATAENWESEFLQMAAFVLLTAVLYQKGSAESKDPESEGEEEDRTPDPARPGAPGPVRRGGLALALYKRSLALVFTLLFAASVVLHAVGGAGDYNEEQAQHGRPERVTVLGYLATSRFWFESLQNWQSEFLALLAVVVLTIFLRQHGSPESKPVDAAHSNTGRE